MKEKLLKALNKEIKKTNSVLNPSKKNKTPSEKILPGYPIYPSEEDIYNHSKKVEEINPEDLSKNKVRNEKDRTPNERNFVEDLSGSHLDILDPDLDNQSESFGGKE